MSKSDPFLVNSYDYRLPEERIANYPAEPRESAKLLIYDRASGETTHTTFGKILDFIPPETAIILNDTKVIKARIFGHKASGGKVELLLNSPLGENRFLVYIRGRVKAGMKLFFDRGLEAEVTLLREDGTREVCFYRQGKAVNFEMLYTLLEEIGHVPLPPYIKREERKEDVLDYQPLFAQNPGAVAAPTASLHFSDQLFTELQKRFTTGYVTLHVGAGTFKPVEVENIEAHVMHSEFYEIPEATRQIIESDRKILAVGTTVTRTVEYYSRTGEAEGACDLFLHPGNPPQRVDFLLTNFHLPRSTLLMLVASFIGVEKTRALYEEAIAEEYRFYSYGDAMLIL